jgi:hypothetical protein
MDDRVTKINNTKNKRLCLMQEVLNNNEKYLIEKIGICRKTLKKWKDKMEVLEKLKNVTIDRALREVLFTKKSQIKCFEWLIKDLNYFSTYNEVKDVIDITRYHYTIVKNYIKEELSK